MRWCNGRALVLTTVFLFDVAVVTITSSNAASAFPQGLIHGSPSFLVARAGVPMAAAGNNTASHWCGQTTTQDTGTYSLQRARTVARH